LKRSGLVVCMLVCACTLLFATDYRVAVVDMSDETSSFFSFFTTLSADVLPGVWKVSEPTRVYLQKQAKRELEIEEWKAISDAYAKETVLQQAPLAVPPVEQETLNAVVETPEVENSAKGIFRKGAYQWFCDAYGYDRLILARQERTAGRNRIVVETFQSGDDAPTSLFDKLSFRDDYQDIEPDMALSLASSMTDDPIGIVLFSERPSSSLSVTDGERIATVRSGYMILGAGRHTLGISSYGYRQKTVDVVVESNRTTTVDARLEPLVIPSLTLVSDIGNVRWFVNGEEKETASSLQLDDVQLPLLIAARKEGFLPQITQVSKPVGTITFNPKPDWWGDATLLSSRQKAFYRAFFALVCSVGLTLVYPTMYEIYGEGSVLPGGLYLAGEGISAMMGLLLLRTAIPYTGSILSF